MPSRGTSIVCFFVRVFLQGVGISLLSWPWMSLRQALCAWTLGLRLLDFLPPPPAVGGLCFGAVQIPGHKSGHRRFLLPLLHQQQWFCLCVQVWREFLHPPQRWADFLLFSQKLVLEARVFLTSLSGLRLWLYKRSLWEGFALVFWRQLVTPCVSIWWRRTLSDLLLCLWLCCEHPVQVYRKELEGECKFPCLRF